MPAPTTQTARFGPATRFEIAVKRKPGPAVEVVDRQNGDTLFHWTGPIAAQLIDSAELPDPADGPGCCFGDKNFVQHLSLIAASAHMAAETSDRHTGRIRREETRWSPLTARLRRLNVRLGSDDTAVARVLFSRPGRHLSHEDVSCLLQLAIPALSVSRVKASLERLTGLGVIKRIEVDLLHVFFDIDTRPHLHIYDEMTGELCDADVDGVIEQPPNAEAATACFGEGARVRVLPVRLAG